MAIRQIIIRGAKQVPPISTDSDDLVELKDSYLLAGATRGVSDAHTVNLKDNNLIELVFEDDTTWFCGPDTLEDVFPGATLATRSATGAFEIPMALQSDRSERGLVSNILLKVFPRFCCLGSDNASAGKISGVMPPSILLPLFFTSPGA